MAEGNVQLKLQASLDLAFLRAQVASLGKSLKTGGVSVVATLNTKQFEKDVAKLRKEVRININDTQVQLLSQRLQKAQDQLTAFKAADNKIVVGVTAKAAVTKKDARKVRSDVYRSIMQNGGKILLPIGLQPVSQNAVNAFKADLQKKLGSINIKVGAATGTMPAAGQGGSAKRPSYLDAPAFKAELEKLSRATFAQLQKGASSLREGRTRSELERLLSQFAQTNPQGTQRTRDLNALREMLARGRYQQGFGIEARMAGGGGPNRRGPFPFVAKSGPISDKALFAESARMAAQIDRANADAAKRAAEQTRAISAQMDALRSASSRLLPAGATTIGPSQQEAAVSGFYRRMRDAERMLAQNFSANSYLPRATRELASAMVSAGASMRALPAGRGIAGALPSSEMLNQRKFQSAIQRAIEIDMQNALRQQMQGRMLPAAGQTAFGRNAQRQLEGQQFQAPSMRGAANATMASAANVAMTRAQRIAQAYARSAARGAAVRAEDLAGLSQSPWGAATVPPRQFFQYGQGPQVPGLPIQPRLPARPAGGGRDRVTGSGQPSPERGGQIVPYGPRTELPSGYLAGGQMAKALRDADQYLRQARVPLAGAIEELGGEFAQATKQVLLYGTAYKALAFFMDLPNQTLRAATALQTFRNQLNAVTGSAEGASRSFGFIDGLANQFSVPLESIRQGFIRMYASMEPAGFGAQEIEGLFSGISKAAATFGMSRDQVDRVTYAFSQMASKGQIMAEELRGQLGDVLPGSLALFAEAAQMSIPDFTKAMEDGRFSGEAMRVVLNNVAILLNTKFAQGAQGAAKTLQGSLNQMQNSLQRLYEAFEPLVGVVAQNVFPLVSAAIKDATKAVQAFTAAAQGNNEPAGKLSAQAKNIFDAMQRVAEIVKSLATIVKGIGPTLAGFGNALLIVTQQLAKFINTPAGGFLANLAIKAALTMAALQLLVRTGIGTAIGALIRFVAQTRATNAALAGTQLQLRLLASGATTAIRPVNLLTRALQGLTRFALIAIAIEVVIQGWAEIDRLKQSLEDISKFSSKDFKKQAETQTREVLNSMLIVNKRTQEQIEKEFEKFSFSKRGPSGLIRQALTGRDEELRARYQKVLIEEQVIRSVLPGAKTEKQKEAELQALPDNAADTGEAQRRAQAYYDAVEQREEGMAGAREQLEESLADIRKRAVEQVAAIEKQYEDRRRQVERDIAKTRRDLAFELQRQEQERGAAGRILAGESPDVIEAERELAQAFNEYTEEKISREEKAQDEQIRKARELEDFRVKISQAINEANQRYAKQTGEIQKAYAQTVAKLISDGSEQGAKKLEAAGLTIAALLKKETIRQGFSAAYPGALLTGDISQSTVEMVRPVDPRRADILQSYLDASQEEQRARQAMGKALRARPATASSPRVAGVDTSDLDASIQAMQQSLEALTTTAEGVQDPFAFVVSVQKTINGLMANYAKGLVSITGSLRDQNDQLKQQLVLREQGLSPEEAQQQAQTVVALEKYRASMNGLIAQAEELNKRTEIRGMLDEKILDLRKELDDSAKLFLAVQNLEAAQNKLLILQLENILSIEEKIKEEREESIRLVQQSVSGAMSSYKEFIGEVLKGKGLKDALVQFQAALRDQAVTMFLDFAFKPMEKMMENQLRQFFNLPSEDELRRQQISKLQEQITLLQQIRDKVGGAGAVAPGNAPAPVAPSGPPPQAESLQVVPYGQPSQSPLTVPHSQRIYDPRAMVAPIGGLFTGQGGSYDQMPDLASAADDISNDASVYNQAVLEPAKGIGSAANFAKVANQSWQQSLGAAVQSIGAAAGAVMSIAGGVSQIKQGGASNVLGGIGSIFMGIGGALGGFGNLGSLFGGGGGATTGMNFAASGPLASVGTVGGLSSGFTMPRFANGGIVNGPTLGLVGEGKYNEAIVPLPDGRSIPVKVAGGPSPREAMANGGMASAGPSVMSFSFETTKINGVEYVSRDQLELAMAATRKEAVKEGAKRGMDMTMDKIRNSPAARQNIAMGRR
jgi:tape measure domain-containing protein